MSNYNVVIDGIRFTVSANSDWMVDNAVESLLEKRNKAGILRLPEGVTIPIIKKAIDEQSKVMRDKRTMQTDAIRLLGVPDSDQEFVFIFSSEEYLSKKKDAKPAAASNLPAVSGHMRGIDNEWDGD